MFLLRVDSFTNNVIILHNKIMCTQSNSELFLIQVLNENGEFVKEKFSKFLEDIISRQPEREKAQKLFNYCYDNGNQFY